MMGEEFPRLLALLEFTSLRIVGTGSRLTDRLIGQEEHGVTGEKFPRLLALLEFTTLGIFSTGSRLTE